MFSVLRGVCIAAIFVSLTTCAPGFSDRGENLIPENNSELDENDGCEEVEDHCLGNKRDLLRHDDTTWSSYGCSRMDYEQTCLRHIQLLNESTSSRHAEENHMYGGAEFPVPNLTENRIVVQIDFVSQFQLTIRLLVPRGERVGVPVDD